MKVDEALTSLVIDVPDYPEPGVVFKDITPLLADPDAAAEALRLLVEHARGHEPELVVGIEARGLILGGAVAHQLSTGFVPIRKKGKLPGATIAHEYKLEYGEAIMEIHDDALQAGEQVLRWLEREHPGKASELKSQLELTDERLAHWQQNAPQLSPTVARLVKSAPKAA